jgi:translation initiation factor 3 subunit L
VKELFSIGCPRFLSPVQPDFAAAPSLEKTTEAFQLQVKIFMDEIKQQSMLSTIRSYLKLYKSMKLDKLASFLDLVSTLCCFTTLSSLPGR